MKQFAIFLALMAVCGCVRYHPKPFVPAETAAALDNRRLDDPGLQKFMAQNCAHPPATWPMTNWDLDALQVAAFYFHPSLAVARAQLQVASAGVKTAGGRLNPTVGLTPGYDSSSMPPLSPWIPFFNVDIPLQTAGKRSKRIAEANHLAESAQWNIGVVAWQIHTAVRASLLDYALAQKRAILLDKQLGIQQRTITFLQERLAAGDIAQPEITTAQLLSHRTQLDLFDARSLSAQARAQLAQAMGVSAAALDGMNLRFDFNQQASENLTSARARTMALTSRMDIHSSLALYAAAESEVRLQIAKQFPDVHFSPGYQFDQGDNKWSLGITFELPILNQNQGPIAEADARRAEAAARFIELQFKTIGLVDLAMAALKTRQETLAPFQTLLASESERLRSAQQISNAGEGEPLDVLGAEVELANTSLLELDARAKYQQALGALEDAVQQPLDSHIWLTTYTALADQKKAHP